MIKQISDNRISQLALLLIAVLLILFRETGLFLQPRFWAEEGQLFYSLSMHHSFWEVLKMVPVGYPTLFNAITGSLQVKLCSYESAPALSTAFGFLIQLIPVIIVLFTKCEYWNSPAKKIIFVQAIVLFTPPELWLNTTNSHFIFGLSTFLILLIDPQHLTRFARLAFNFIIILSVLSGPESMLLFPFYFWSYSINKNPQRLTQVIIITFCSLIQGSVLIHSLLFSNNYQRLSANNVNDVLNAFFADNFSLNTGRSYIGMIMLAILVLILFYSKNRSGQTVLIGSFLIVAIFSTLGSLEMKGAPRYSYFPSCILFLLILQFASEYKYSNLFSVNSLAMLIIIASLGISLAMYKYRMHYVYNSELPVWKNEIIKFRKDSTYRPKIHPDYLFVKL